ncbi:uncharacterized protein LOC134253823 [Saccostrea cucullata]|uniref:uncharacterized protein LOC134253823 n=1 Tax=Saccostrea cuccullata TaxID=36930 RepID=UPI002ED2A352
MHLEILSVLLLLKTVEILCYDVLSHKKPAFQSATLSWIGSEANSAVDGNLATCARTDVIGSNSQQDRTWWYVDLGDIYSVYNIRIHFEDIGKAYILRQRGRFAGFSLYLSSSTIKENGYMCYKDGPELPPLNFTTNCTGYGRYVIYYNERLNGVKYPAGYESMSYTQLCEVVVKGCSRGKFGINCTMNCPTNCCGGKCDIINGKCMECKPGWEGEKCQTFCLKGSYGQDCKFRCSGHCRDGTSCDHVTGECAEGCVSGWTGSICNKTCDNGHYGINCSSTCSGHCLYDKACNKETGYCESGCSDGYTGNLCQNECTPGWFGHDCTKRCSGHCANKAVCNHMMEFVLMDVKTVISDKIVPHHVLSNTTVEIVPIYILLNARVHADKLMVLVHAVLVGWVPQFATQNVFLIHMEKTVLTFAAHIVQISLVTDSVEVAWQDARNNFMETDVT